MRQSATRRSLAILELLAEYPEGLPLGELGQRLDLPKSVAHRLLSLLTDEGYTRQDRATGYYALTLKLTLLGARHLAGIGLGDVSQPILDRLARATGELVRLTVVEGDGLVWVGKAQGARHGLRYDPDAGTQVVLHATATGKAWLATLPESEAMRIVAATAFRTPEHFGPNVIRDAERFRDELARTRARGYGLAVEEGEPGTAAVAVVVHGSAATDAPAVGTLSVAGPVGRFTADRCRRFVAELQSAAAELSGLWPLRAPCATAPAPPRVPDALEERGVLQHA
jgi:DNA-binding IclR family transcriptional regulator